MANNEIDTNTKTHKTNKTQDKIDTIQLTNKSRLNNEKTCNLYNFTPEKAV
jgi:hypothetical protein